MGCAYQVTRAAGLLEALREGDICLSLKVLVFRPKNISSNTIADPKFSSRSKLSSWIACSAQVRGSSLTGRPSFSCERESLSGASRNRSQEKGTLGEPPHWGES